MVGSVDDPHCMNCRRRFDRDILTTGLSCAFVCGTYKAHRESVLFDREYAMMPATQPFVRQEIQRRANMQLMSEMQLERARAKHRLREIDRAMHNLLYTATPPIATDERRAFVHRCAQPDCRGFLSAAWKCGVCDKYTCSECNAPRGTDREDAHVCNEGERETMRLLKRDSKKCPGCGEFIFKISGCDQMWCTSCHTAFSWRTGLKINGNIHNPHFYEFSRRGGTIQREAGDIPCGGMPTQREILVALRAHRVMHSRDADFLMGLYRLALHIEDVEVPHYDTPDINENTNKDLRIQFTLNEITEAHFKSKLQQREKKADKCIEIHQVLQLVTQTSADCFRAAIIDHDYNTCIANMIALIEYANDILKKISRKYKCVVPHMLKDTGRITTGRF
tara:strand:+ start:1006 stop:2181 length:1176 start_codon:yes stop_codon:yes gene_type:complete